MSLPIKDIAGAIQDVVDGNRQPKPALELAPAAELNKDAFRSELRRALDHAYRNTIDSRRSGRLLFPL